MPSWLNHFVGADNLSGPFYGWWSGILGSFVTSTIAFGLGYWWHHNCHEHHCWRIGRFSVLGSDGTTFRACRHHHPNLDHRVGFHFASHRLTQHHFRSRACSEPVSDQP